MPRPEAMTSRLAILPMTVKSATSPFYALPARVRGAVLIPAWPCGTR